MNSQQRTHAPFPKRTASALALGGPALSVLSWWLDKKDIKLPDWLVDGIGIIGVLMLLVALGLSIRWLAQMRRPGRDERREAERIAPKLDIPIEVSHAPLREAARELFEAVQSLPVAEFIRLEETAEAKIDWAINWILTLKPPPEILGVEPPSSRQRAIVFTDRLPRLISGTDKLAAGRVVFERTVIRRSDVTRAIDRLKNSVFN
jgi:hypothetical protein